MRALHYSGVEAMARCPRGYELSYESGIDARGYKSALVVGSGMHAAGEQIRHGHGQKAAWNAGKAVVTAATIPEAAEQAQRDGWKLWAMVQGYFHSLKITPDQPPVSVSHPDVEVVANELQLQAPLLNPATGYPSRTFVQEGTVDAIIWMADGARWPGTYGYEMKTTGTSLDETEGYLRAGIQVPSYQQLLQLGVGAGLEEINGTVVDIIKKPVLRPRNNKKSGKEPLSEWAKRCLEAYKATPERFFRRLVLPYDEGQVRDAMAIFWATARQIRECGRWGYPAVLGPGCQTPYGWCRYKYLCWHHDTEGYEHKDGSDSHNATIQQEKTT